MKLSALIVCLVLVVAGIYLVIESKNNYDQSRQQYKELSEKFFDSSFKKPINLVSPSYSVVRDGYSQALSYFMLALGLLLLVFLLPRLQNLSIGPSGINLTLKDLQQTVGALVSQTNTIQSNLAGEGGIRPGGRGTIKTATKGAGKMNEGLEDPQKGKWGGEAERNSRKMSATVKESAFPGFYVVNITVESTDPEKPLEGVVKFHLHDTFLNPDPVIAVKDRKAVLKLTKVWGAFTVGAEADNGKTTLELDLAELDGVPEKFKQR
jgi:hypothetical protein